MRHDPRAVPLEDRRAEDCVVDRAREDDERERLGGASADRADHVLGESGGRTAVDDDHPRGGYDEGVIGYVTAVRAARLLAGAIEHVDALAELDGLRKRRREACGRPGGERREERVRGAAC